MVCYAPNLSFHRALRSVLALVALATRLRACLALNKNSALPAIATIPAKSLLLIFDGGFKLLHPLVALFAVHAGKQDRH